MDAIFIACGAGGPQLKRNPLDGDAIMNAREVTGAILIFLPGIIALYLLVRLSGFRRDGQGLAPLFSGLAAFHALRPDLYTDEGQPLLRLLWAVTVLTIPWVVFVVGV